MSQPGSSTTLAKPKAQQHRREAAFARGVFNNAFTAAAAAGVADGSIPFPESLQYGAGPNSPEGRAEALTPKAVCDVCKVMIHVPSHYILATKYINPKDRHGKHLYEFVDLTKSTLLEQTREKMAQDGVIADDPKDHNIAAVQKTMGANQQQYALCFRCASVVEFGQDKDGNDITDGFFDKNVGAAQAEKAIFKLSNRWNKMQKASKYPLSAKEAERKLAFGMKRTQELIDAEMAQRGGQHLPEDPDTMSTVDEYVNLVLSSEHFAKAVDWIVTLSEKDQADVSLHYGDPLCDSPLVLEENPIIRKVCEKLGMDPSRVGVYPLTHNGWYLTRAWNVATGDDDEDKKITDTGYGIVNKDKPDQYGVSMKNWCNWNCAACLKKYEQSWMNPYRLITFGRVRALTAADAGGADPTKTKDFLPYVAYLGETTSDHEMMINMMRGMQLLKHIKAGTPGWGTVDTEITPSIILDALQRHHDSKTEELMHRPNVVTLRAVDLQKGKATKARKVFVENATLSLPAPGAIFKVILIEKDKIHTLSNEDRNEMIGLISSFLNITAHFGSQQERFRGDAHQRALKEMLTLAQHMRPRIGPVSSSL
jgi:hypothetical protein